jgi:hypothetical protein
LIPFEALCLMLFAAAYGPLALPAVHRGPFGATALPLAVAVVGLAVHATIVALTVDPVRRVPFMLLGGACILVLAWSLFPSEPPEA